MVDLRERDNFNQGQPNPIEVQKMYIPGLRNRLGRILLHLYLLDPNPDFLAIFCSNPIMRI